MHHHGYCSLLRGIEAGFVHLMHFGIFYLPTLSFGSPLLEWLKWYLEPLLEQKGREPGLELLISSLSGAVLFGLRLSVGSVQGLPKLLLFIKVILNQVRLLCITSFAVPVPRKLINPNLCFTKSLGLE